MDKEKEKDYLSSLKSIETENYIDRIFYRPIGYRIAKAIKDTGITPNTITIISIFVGVAGGIFWFYPYNITFAVLGILSLVAANILDCVDGQLARLTGIKSEIGRILDGIAGDIWFAAVYIAFAYRLNIQFDTWIFTPVIFISAYSHLNQAAMTDYYKTLHLFFISKEKGKEFESSADIKERLKSMPTGINKIFTQAYYYYTWNQERQTPRLQVMLKRLKSKYGNDIPDEVRTSFRSKSSEIMTLLNMITFNGRSIVLFLSVFFNILWVYFIWEIVVLNLVKMLSRIRYEKASKNFEI
ncbi:MAG: CDP-alcohol phosphatidyltransferase family protein [Paludibacteraceae bacterium]